ncbi:(-)-isopiperitenol/(-)-carveol dehydrogenase, mitochondrial [Armadillidium nasatum]|uniref:(-)-isopiperitenol/(-)-carveol dehydrogenase, mitochondrial n=1 Tax=Armadillidium nasatum TaxID=96803 RepID=A0A5N5TPD7_9CRUS|nr:(-)-isopiperitenol/(-)-carveol dehydrogenase, mitochondrial [Armadillidium nasatum]
MNILIFTLFTHSSMERWVGRVALVTGASVGIGASICEVLVQSGLKTLSETLKDAKGSLLPVKCDLTKEEDIRNLFDKIKKEFGGVDICINNAGLSNGKKLLDSTVEEMKELTNVNIIALCLCSQLAIASMRERGVDDGHVINVSSIGGHRVSPKSSSRFYASTKFASWQVNTQFAYRAFKDPERAKNLYSSIEPLRPEDVAASVLHVISAPPHVEINDIIIRPTEQQQ